MWTPAERIRHPLPEVHWPTADEARASLWFSPIGRPILMRDRATFGPGRPSAPTQSSSPRSSWAGVMPVTLQSFSRISRAALRTACSSTATAPRYTSRPSKMLLARTSTTRCWSSTTGTRRGRREALQPRRLYWHDAEGHHREPRREAHLHELRGAPEPHNANEHARLHAAHERLLEEDRQPLSFHRAALHVLQLRADSPNAQDHPAMAAGVTDKLWDIADMVALLD